MRGAGLVLAAYTLGSVPTGYLVAQYVAGVDVRRAGSGNVGATNVARVAGAAPGVLVAFLDIAKGATAVWLAQASDGRRGVAVACALAAVLGHVFPIWLRFRGGKGVATAAGACALLVPLAAAVAAAVFVAIVAATRYVSLGSVTAALVLVAMTIVRPPPWPTILGVAAIGALVVARHRTNLERLWRGTEARLGAASSPLDVPERTTWPR